MKNRTVKKQLRRLWDATGHYYRGRDFEEYLPAKKPISGKSARRLVSAQYRILANYEYGWANIERPKFCPTRQYIILAEQDGQTSSAEYLRIVRAKDTRGWKKGLCEINLEIE